MDLVVGTWSFCFDAIREKQKLYRSQESCLGAVEKTINGKPRGHVQFVQEQSRAINFSPRHGPFDFIIQCMLFCTLADYLL